MNTGINIIKNRHSEDDTFHTIKPENFKGVHFYYQIVIFNKRKESRKFSRTTLI